MSGDYVVAMYLRLSLDDGKERESGSIAHQRDMLARYLDEHQNLSHCRRVEYSDDGYSGTNFNRPGVVEMLEKVGKREVNCIVVKDLSRFGRSYIEVGNFLEQVFPFLDVRFISINDGYDSACEATAASGIELALKMLVYDLYSKDLSAKLRSAKLAQIRRGEFIAPNAPYGYRKSAEVKNKLEVDEDTAWVVRYIFELAAAGERLAEIARILSAKDVPPPNARWSGSKVRRILQDERYTGSMVGHKYEHLYFKAPQTSVPRDRWIVVPDTHEAIIPKAVFDDVLCSLDTSR
ncbi:MAG: recombinase family protein [Defluviitaleaceae bacterium]|nr:recombinase family protein [Defluviitaleaceae bacterium]